MTSGEMQAQLRGVGEPSTNVLDQIERGLNVAPEGEDTRLQASGEIQFIVSQSKKAGNGLFKEKKYKGQSSSSSSQSLVNAGLAVWLAELDPFLFVASWLRRSLSFLRTNLSAGFDCRRNQDVLAGNRRG